MPSGRPNPLIAGVGVRVKVGVGVGVGVAALTVGVGVGVAALTVGVGVGVVPIAIVPMEVVELLPIQSVAWAASVYVPAGRPVGTFKLVAKS